LALAGLPSTAPDARSWAGGSTRTPRIWAGSIATAATPRLRPSSFCAIVTVPTFEECCRICETVIVSVPRGSASWIRRSATMIE
jgi:hypothetical protein